MSSQGKGTSLRRPNGLPFMPKSGLMLVPNPTVSKGDGIAMPGLNETQGRGQGWGLDDVKSSSVTTVQYQRVVVEIHARVFGMVRDSKCSVSLSYGK